jgi:hypothetical protein
MMVMTPDRVVVDVQSVRKFCWMHAASRQQMCDHFPMAGKLNSFWTPLGVSRIPGPIVQISSPVSTANTALSIERCGESYRTLYMDASICHSGNSHLRLRDGRFRQGSFNIALDFALQHGCGVIMAHFQHFPPYRSCLEHLKLPLGCS